MSDTPPTPTATDASTAAPSHGPPRYRRERMAVGIVFFAITGAVIVNGAMEIHRDTFRGPRAPSSYATCSAGINALYAEFASRLDTVQPSGPGVAPHFPSRDPETRAALAQLDEQLTALRPVCAREGRAASAAYDAFTLWRYRVQDFSRMEERTLNADAERALRYQSPAPSAPPGTEP